MHTNSKLNQYFEIVGLLYTCAHPDFQEKELWQKAATEYNISAAELDRRIRPLPNKYFTAFQKSMSSVNKEDFNFYFADEDPEFILLLQFVSGEHPEWFEGGSERITDEKTMIAFADVLSSSDEAAFDTPPSTNEVITLLKATGYSPSTCWKMMLLLQAPAENIRKLSYMVQQNIPAYETALASVNIPLNKLLDSFSKSKSFCDALHQETVVTPTLVCPTLELVRTSGHSSVSYIGLLVNELYQLFEQSRTAQEKLLPILKALSDGSKFDILLSLLKSPKYNLELADELNLTAATVSHHMNVLLSHQLVDVKKKDGRVYYTIAKDTLQRTIQELQTIFFNH